MTTTITACLFVFYSFPLLCIALCVTLTCMNGSKLTLQCILFKCTQLEWQRCSSSLPLLIQAYFRQGVALQYLGRHADALAAFASGLAQDPKSLQLLVGMVEAAMKSPLRGELERSDQTPGRCHLPFVLIPNICRHSSRARFTRRRSSWHRMKETGKKSVGK